MKIPEWTKQCKYPMTVKIDIEWPDTILYNGVDYVKSSRGGRRMSDDTPDMLYYSCSDYLPDVWLNIDGTTNEA